MVGGWADAAGQPSGTVMRHISERSEKEGWCFSKKACCAHVCTRAIFQAFHQLVQIGSAYYLSTPLHIPFTLSCSSLLFLPFCFFLPALPLSFSSSPISLSPFLSQSILISHLCRFPHLHLSSHPGPLSELSRPDRHQGQGKILW